jgi:hypothetical protein
VERKGCDGCTVKVFHPKRRAEGREIKPLKAVFFCVSLTSTKKNYRRQNNPNNKFFHKETVFYISA